MDPILSLFISKRKEHNRVRKCRVITKTANPYLEIEERRVRLSAGELESAKKDANSDSYAIRQEKALAEIANGVGDTRLVAGVVARREVLGPTSCGGALAALELLDGIAEAVLGLSEAAVGVGAV